MSPLLFTTIVAAYLCGANGQSACTASGGGQGTCVDIYKCEPLLALVRKPDRTQQDLEALKKSQCGFQGGKPLVCCPSECHTPDGKPGKCINIYSCEHLTQMLRPPTSKENMLYVQNSRCKSADQYSVCCGPAPLVTPPPPAGSCRATVSALLPNPADSCCGLDANVGNKIVGGTATAIDQYPWLIVIEYVSDNRIKLLCGGSLISGRYVLTAGHCIAGAVLQIGKPTNIRLGEYDTANSGPDCVVVEAGGTDCTEDIVVIPIEQIIPHPEYNPVSPQRKNDIALIRMSQMAPYTDFIRPICLPSADITVNTPNKTVFYAAGWGAVSTNQISSDVKSHVDLPYIPHSICQPAYSVQNRKITLWNKQICAGGVPGKDSCKGDSGGPLMYENGRQYEVVGVVSFGPTPCGLPDIPGVYTKVYEYLDWIRSTVKS